MHEAYGTTFLPNLLPTNSNIESQDVTGSTLLALSRQGKHQEIQHRNSFWLPKECSSCGNWRFLRCTSFVGEKEKICTNTVMQMSFLNKDVSACIIMERIGKPIEESDDRQCFLEFNRCRSGFLAIRMQWEKPCLGKLAKIAQYQKVAHRF
jgi:hypothetical protein